MFDPFTDDLGSIFFGTQHYMSARNVVSALPLQWVLTQGTCPFYLRRKAHVQGFSRPAFFSCPFRNMLIAFWAKCRSVNCGAELLGGVSFWEDHICGAWDNAEVYTSTGDWE